MRLNPTERIQPKENGSAGWLCPSLGVRPEGGSGPAALSTWVAKGAPEPGVFHPARHQSELERTKGWRWSPGSARLASGGPRWRWVASWQRGSALLCCVRGHCSLISWGPQSGAGAVHSRLPVGVPPQRPHPGTDGRCLGMGSLRWSLKSLGMKQKAKGSWILPGWSLPLPRSPTPPQVTYFSVRLHSGRSFWELLGFFLCSQVPQLEAGAPSAQEGLAWAQGWVLCSGQRHPFLV